MPKFSLPIFFNFTISAILTTSAISNDDVTDRLIEAKAYEKCVEIAFDNSFKVSNAFKECEAEMNEYLSTFDEKTKENIKQIIKVETRRTLTKKTLTNNNEG